MQITLNGKPFTLAPNLGHCLAMKARGIDLLGDGGRAEIEKIVASPEASLIAVEVLIADQTDDDVFKMPAIASLMTGAIWTDCRRAVLESFRDFFLASGFPLQAAALAEMETASDEVTKQVAESLNSGALRKRMDKAVADSVRELETIGD